MFAYVLLRGDSESVLLPLFWVSVIVAVAVVVLGTIIGAIWLWARYYWILKPRAEHPLRELNKAELKAVERALDRATSEDERMRLRAVLLSAQGYGVHEIVHLTDADRSDIEGWLALYEEMGLEVLCNKHDVPQANDKSGSMPADMVTA